MRLSTLLTLSLLFAFEANASVEKAKAALDKREEHCQAHQHTITKIDDPWLLSLDTESQKIALSMLSDIAMQTCIEKQDKQYLYQLYILYVTTDNRELLDSYLILKNSQFPSYDQHKQVTREFKKQVNRLAKTPSFQHPFNVNETFMSLVQQLR